MLRKSTNQISIKPKVSAGVKLAILMASSIVLVLALYLTYDAGINSGNQQLVQDHEMIERLNETILNLETDITTSQQELIVAQRHQQIQEEAYKQISSAYSGAEKKNRYLGSRLDFYRSIISPEDGQAGPSIQSAEVTQNGENISFEVVLVQAIKHKHQIRGNIKIDIYDGQKLLGKWPTTNARNINFQYFQQISGVIEATQLSDNARMRVELQIQGGEKIERWFDISAKSNNA